MMLTGGGNEAPSMYGTPGRSASNWPTLLFPVPDTPITTTTPRRGLRLGGVPAGNGPADRGPGGQFGCLENRDQGSRRGPEIHATGRQPQAGRCDGAAPRGVERLRPVVDQVGACRHRPPQPA